MLVDAKETFLAKRANDGDIDALCKIIDIHALRDDWFAVGKCFEILVENEPRLCERKIKEASGDTVTYEMMLAIVGGAYTSIENFPLIYRWYQKYIDYMEFKFGKDHKSDWFKNKYQDKFYKYMLETGELNKTEHRFMLRWEFERLKR